LGGNQAVVPVFTYVAFGLNICSDLECGELRPGDGIAHVRVRFGHVPENLQEPSTQGVLYQASRGKFLLQMDGVARYLISNGDDIVIEPAPGAEADAIRLFLLGSAFGVLLHQRNVLPVHGSAIVTPRGAVIFAGPSGHGKSTLAGAFHNRGYPVLADEICAVGTTGTPLVFAGSPYLMLWADALEKLGKSNPGLLQARSHLEKYILPLDDGFAVEAVPLHALYVLEMAQAGVLGLSPVTRLAKIRAVARCTYREQFVKGMGLVDQHLKQIGEVARNAPVTCIQGRKGSLSVDELADLLERDFAA
jgi:hypothetical protein